MLWIGGTLNCRDSVVTKYGCQTDIATTLLDQIEINSDEFLFGKDLLNPHSPSYAYYSIHNAFGYITDSVDLVYDLVKNDYIREKGLTTEFDKDIGKAYLQNLLDDFANR